MASPELKKRSMTKTSEWIWKATSVTSQATLEMARRSTGICIGCHGDIGDGNGENTPWMEPFKPRNFTLGIFKCRSTPTGTLPTDDDLFRTLHRGLNTSDMPHWAH